ncbi:MAG TPA: hypothetical protein VNR87_11110 [Flavisolibacter sp.]|nr:hypothetical protein [Flavisolibacter sp.]
MHEFDSGGIDPDTKKYFRKIMNSFSFGLLWLLSVSTAGLFLQLGVVRNGMRWYNILFYFLFLLSFALLLRYFYRVWKK